MADSIKVLDNERTFNYVGLSVDVPSNLPTTGIHTGSAAYAADTGDFYIYIEETEQWYKQDI